MLMLGGVMLVVFATESDDLASDVAPRTLDRVALLLCAAAGGLVLLRRRFPLTVVVGVLVVAGIWNSRGYTNGVINAAALIAYFTVGETGDRRKQVAALALTTVPLVAYMTVAGAPWWWLVPNTGWPLAAVLFGELSRSRRALLDAYQRRAEQAEADRDTEARRRVAEERLRMARDLHDLLGHTVSLMTVQASVAADKFDRAPARARAAIDHIRAAGRQANCEVRATIELLRNHENAPPLEPAPSLADVEALAASTARLGLEVHCDVEPAAYDVDPLAGLTVYRIVQEALTNVVRHAGARHVWIAVGTGDGVVRCVVTDDGTSAGGAVVAGNGLRGMAERVALAGGTLRYGPRRGGGFEVAATLPARGGRA